MKRREFIVMTAAATTLPLMAQAVGTQYAPGLAVEKLAAGKTVFLDLAPPGVLPARHKRGLSRN